MENSFWVYRKVLGKVCGLLIIFIFNYTFLEQKWTEYRMSTETIVRCGTDVGLHILTLYKMCLCLN